MPLELTHLLLLMLCYYPPVKDSRDSHYVIHNSIFPKDYSSFITMAQRLLHFTIYITHLGTMLWNGLIITTDPNKWRLTCTLTSSTRAKNVSQRIFSEEALDSKIFIESRFQSHSASAQKIFHSNETRALLWNFAGTAGYFRSCKWKKLCAFTLFRVQG